MGVLFPVISILVLDVVGRSSVSSILCYRCGLTQEKVIPAVDSRTPWPTGLDAVTAGLVECGLSPMTRFLINCTEAATCHKITWGSDEFAPIRFCFPRKTQCDNLLLKLKGDAICDECNEDRCNE